MRVSRRKTVVRLHLEPQEHMLLTEMLRDLAASVTALAPGDAVWDRMHPAVYEDAQSAAEFRAMTEDDLDGLRAERIAQCQAGLDTHGTEIPLADADLDCWLRTINDLRLGHGTRLGVQADDDPDDPKYQDDPARLVYTWLTWMQDALINAAMDGI
jgi:hypothetical protein